MLGRFIVVFASLSLACACTAAAPRPSGASQSEELPYDSFFDAPPREPENGQALVPIRTGPRDDGAPVPYPNGAPSVAAPPPTSLMTFFVTSTGNANGGDSGGLAGADKKCQDLAMSAGAGAHTWRAYLSAQGVNAKRPDGPGPWKNQKGRMIAANVAALHDFGFMPANDDVLDEKGAMVPAGGAAILTGTKADGTGLGDTCSNWTSSDGAISAHVGDAAAATSVFLGVHWNDAVKSQGCSRTAMTRDHGEGRVYCFAAD